MYCHNIVTIAIIHVFSSTFEPSYLGGQYLALLSSSQVTNLFNFIVANFREFSYIVTALMKQKLLRTQNVNYAPVFDF